MKIALQKLKKNTLVEIYIINIIILCYVFRTSIPPLKYLFIALSVGFFPYMVIYYWNRFRKTFKAYARSFFLILLLSIILIGAFLISDKRYIVVFKDVVNTLVLLFIFFSMFLVINEKKKSALFVNSFIKLIIVFGLLISSYGLFTFFVPYGESEILSLSKTFSTTKGSPQIDYNFALLAIFYGLLAILNFFSVDVPLKTKRIYTLILIIYTANILISGSRRGIIVLSFIILVLLAIKFITLFKNGARFKALSLNVNYFLLVIFIIAIVLSTFFLLVPHKQRNKTIAFICPNTASILKEKISLTVCSYFSIFNERYDYSFMYNKLWIPSFDPVNPYSWCTQKFTEIHSLEGDQSHIIPNGAVGCLFDKTVHPAIWSGDAYMYNKIYDGNAQPGEFILASVYCFVSEDFNGDWVRLSAAGNTDQAKSYYDLRQKVKWQKLKIAVECHGGPAPILLFFSQRGVSDFSNLEGHVIFAYPEFEQLNQDISKNRISADPDFWTSHKYSRVDSITGKNSEIVPQEAIGCLFDSTSDAVVWNGNANMFNVIRNVSVSPGDILFASIYCYVSEDFEGDQIRFSSGKRTSETLTYYEMHKKGEWQKLNITVECYQTTAAVVIYLTKNGVVDFSDMKGHVIFAYPEIAHVKRSDLSEHEYSIDPIYWAKRECRIIDELTGENVGIVPEDAKGCLMDKSVSASTFGGDAIMHNIIGKETVHSGDQVYASVYCYVTEDFNGNWVRLSAEGNTSKKADYYDFEKKGEWQLLQITADCDDGEAPIYLYFRKNGETDFTNLKGSVIFAYPKVNIIRKTIVGQFTIQSDDNYLMSSANPISIPLTLLAQNINQNNDRDPLRAWVSNFIAEDTLYHPYKAQIIIDSVSNASVGERIYRWQFAWKIFTKEYTGIQKAFGGGFAYLNWYGYFFYGDKTRSDWPHNPFISVLLYSGVLGLILYLYLIYKVFAIYIKYIKEYYILFVFFCITFFFSFFSAGNPFDPPVMGFLVMLPFLIDYIHKHDKSSKSDKLLKR